MFDLRRYVSRGYAVLLVVISGLALTLMTIGILGSSSGLPGILIVFVCFAYPLAAAIFVIYATTLYLYWKYGDA